MENLAMEVVDLICYEETATNEEAIKDVQDAQSTLTQAIQILADFYAKAGQAGSLTQHSLFSEAHSTWPKQCITVKNFSASTAHVSVDPGLQRKSGGRYKVI